MFPLSNLALTILALTTGCKSSDDRVLEGPTTPAPPDVGLEDPPDPAPVVDEALTRSEYIYRLLCSRNGDSIFRDRVLASDRYELYGARKETRNEPGDRSTRTVWAAYLRRLNEPPNEATDRYEVDDFLGKDFHIIEITADKVTVINERCGMEEVIPLNRSSPAEIGMVVEETEDSDDPYGNRYKAKEDWLEDALEDAHGPEFSPRPRLRRCRRFPNPSTARSRCCPLSSMRSWPSTTGSKCGD